MAKLDNKLSNLIAADKRLKEAVTAYKNNRNNDLYRDALIQRFEFTYELAWKTTAEVLREQGLNPIQSPRAVLKNAYEIGFIDDEETWLNIIEDRNIMSHTYNQNVAIRIADDICKYYEKAINSLIKKLS